MTAAGMIKEVYKAVNAHSPIDFTSAKEVALTIATVLGFFTAAAVLFANMQPLQGLALGGFALINGVPIIASMMLLLGSIAKAFTEDATDDMAIKAAFVAAAVISLVVGFIIGTALAPQYFNSMPGYPSITAAQALQVAFPLVFPFLGLCGKIVWKEIIKG